MQEQSTLHHAVLNRAELQLAVESAKQNAEPLASVFKSALTTCWAELEQQFYAKTDVEILLSRHSNFVDDVLKVAWQQFDWLPKSSANSSTCENAIAMVAVGGYGRGELHPHSDIDLLLLLENDHYEVHGENIQQFIQLLWDMGLEVGHSVRSIQESVKQATADVTIISNLIESRFLCGDDALLPKIQALITPDTIWNHREFYEAKIEEQRFRHRKSADTEYSLEPNVKISPGGLRDIQTVMWIAKRHYGSVNFDSLHNLGFLTPRERDILRGGERKLWKTRYALHLISGKDENRLLFEHQRQLAEIFGYKDGEQLAVEQFMQAYYRAAMTVNTTTAMLLSYFEEDLASEAERRDITILDDCFQIRNKHIEVRHSEVFEQHPPALLGIFLHIGSNKNIKGTAAATIRLIRESHYLIDDEFRNDPNITKLFLELLRTSEKLSSQLVRMERYGILSTYLPEFGRIIGQMQFDLFHIYTVDSHTLQVVRNMRRFRYQNEEQKFPIASHIYGKLPKIELLFIAGLYHDIAKGMGGDHSVKGVDIARAFCERHRLPTWDTNLVCWLVRNHLYMSNTAQRKDISDPEVIQEFALLVQDQVRLDYLYALTVADINATNPTLWNSWRASLMRQLYMETKKALRHGIENYVDRSDYIRDNQTEIIDRLAEHDITEDQARSIWSWVDDDYFIRESITDIVWHTVAMTNHHLDDGPLILIRDIHSRRDNEGATQIFIYTRKSENIFTASVTAIDYLGLDILDAKIASSDHGLVFDTFIVLEADGTPVGENTRRVNTIKETLADAFSSLDSPVQPLQRRTPRLLKPFKFRTEVATSQNSKDNTTLIEVITPDRPGLLSIIANIFAEMEIQLVLAKITTLGERVEDMFYITDRAGNRLTDTDVICQRIRTELDDHVSKAN